MKEVIEIFRLITVLIYKLAWPAAAIICTVLITSAIERTR